MTLAQQVECALKREQWCRSRRKASKPHHKEATLTAAYVLARENQKNGAHYSLQILRALRPANNRVAKKLGTRLKALKGSI